MEDTEIINQSEVNTTEDCGYTEIEVAKVGEYNGSDKDGNPIKEVLTEESLKNIVEEVNASGREILVDKQHNSMKTGQDRDDSACGWLKALSFRNGSIFGKCFWTKLGRELIDSRILRFISPVFNLGKDGVPTKLVNVALVNQPALTDINPVINSQPTEIKEDIITMNKEELINLIKETVKSMNSCSEQKDKEIVNSCQDGEDKKEVAVNAETTDTETSITEPVTKEEPGVKTVVDKQVVEEKTEHVEVIKEEVLNNAPTIGTDISGKAEWENLHGKEFFDWYKKHQRGY